MSSLLGVRHLTDINMANQRPPLKLVRLLLGVRHLTDMVHSLYGCTWFDAKEVVERRDNLGVKETGWAASTLPLLISQDVAAVHEAQLG